LLRASVFTLRCSFLLHAEIYILMLCAGLYIGSMGPHSAEVVQLQRKYGNWQTNDTFSINQELQCFEYVEAVKLTGDVNVPAGQVLIYLNCYPPRLASSALLQQGWSSMVHVY
jgi:hypothetical protein